MVLPLLYPTAMFRRVTEISAAYLRSLGVSALILDADNTLTTHNNPQPADDVMDWLERMRGGGIKLVIVSNNNAQRIRPFARRLGLAYTSGAMKPLTVGFRRTAEKMGLLPEQIAVVGDQIFTDILGGNLFGSPTILVEPMQPEDGPFFRLKRKLEGRILRRYQKRKGRLR